MKLFWKTGEPYVLATGASLAIILVMSLTLVGIVMFNGLGYFWPRALVKFELKDGSSALGQIMQQEKNPISGTRRLQMKVGNRDVFGQDFRWIDEKDIASRTPAGRCGAAGTPRAWQLFRFSEGCYGGRDLH